MKEYHEWNMKLTMAGHIVYSVVIATTSDKSGIDEDVNLKRHLDLIHLAKIEESDAIFVIDVGNYIGESTKREIEWATIREKRIFCLTEKQFYHLLGVQS